MFAGQYGAILSTLCFQDCPTITAVAEREFIQRCPALTRLVVSAACVTLQTTLAHAPQLKVLSCHPTLTGVLDDGDLEFIVRTFPALEVFSTSKAIAITDEGVIRLAESSLPIKDLRLVNTTDEVNLGISDASIAAIAEHCPLLERLYIYGFPNVTNSSFAAILTMVPRLRELKMARCGFAMPAAEERMLLREHPELEFMREARCLGESPELSMSFTRRTRLPLLKSET